eukprot:scaffold312492_cov14-Tisochrysis_lutea.AAC.1
MVGIPCNVRCLWMLPFLRPRKGYKFGFSNPLGPQMQPHAAKGQRTLIDMVCTKQECKELPSMEEERGGSSVR